MPRQGKLLSYLTFLSVKEVLERGEKSKGILSRRQHWDNSVPDTLGSRSGFDKDPHPTEQLAILVYGIGGPPTFSNQSFLSVNSIPPEVLE